MCKFSLTGTSAFQNDFVRYLNTFSKIIHKTYHHWKNQCFEKIFSTWRSMPFHTFQKFSISFTVNSKEVNVPWSKLNYPIVRVHPRCNVKSSKQMPLLTNCTKNKTKLDSSKLFCHAFIVLEHHLSLWNTIHYTVVKFLSKGNNINAWNKYLKKSNSKLGEQWINK